MPYTGERFVPEQGGNIELEHLHRYLVAADVCAGRDVLDIASGEGYGTSLLARRARSAVGVDIAADAVGHARAKYAAAHLDYRVGSAARIPLDDASVDVVVSFETIEHHDQHHEMLAEIRRVLRPEGLLIMSSPDKHVYSELPGFSNPYHVKELTRDEFDALIGGYFAHHRLYGQRIVYGSALLAEQPGCGAGSFAKRPDGIARATGLVEPMYLIAVASDGPLPTLAAGVFDTDVAESDAMAEARRQLAARDHEIGEFREGRTALEAAFAQVRQAEEGARAELARSEAGREAERAAADEQARQLESARAGMDTMRTELVALRAERDEMRRSVTRLSADVGALNAAVHAYRASFSWRLTAPVRMATRALRRVARIALIPVRIAQAQRHGGATPVRDIAPAAGGGYVSTGDDPQCFVPPHWSGLRPGWAAVDIALTTPEPFPRPVLYAFAGDDGAQVHAYPMADFANGRVKRLIMLPPGVRSLRFDPTDRAGVPFDLQHVSVRPLSRVGLVRAAWSMLDAEKRRGVIAALLRRRFGAARLLLSSAILGASGTGAYQAWVDQHDTLDEADLARLRELGAQLATQPLISVLMPVYNPRPKYLRQALDSVLAQTYENWELCIADDASTNPEIRQVLDEYRAKDARVRVVYRETNGHISASSNSALEIVRGEFVALMDHDDALPAHALYLIAAEIDAHPDVDLIYTDEDKVDENDRRHDPHFKTDWNRELFYSQNFIAHLGVYRSSIMRRIGGFRVGFEGSQDYDFALRFLLHTQAEKIRHIPHVLYHWRIFPGVTSFSTDNPDKSIDTARRAMNEYFAVAEPDAKVEMIERFPGWWRIRRPLPDPLPRVSLIVPTRDRREVLEVAVNGLLYGADYPDLELIVVDNDSVEPDTLAYFERIAKDPRVTILKVPGPFNFSALNNRAVEIATGTVLGFMNNDLKVIHADWLAEMVSQLARPNVGAVGAKLYYANETIQHAGVQLGLYGVAAHGHRHGLRETIGYFGRPMLVQNTSAVTAACMLVTREAFARAGGYDEVHLKVGYNDVDLCLKIREAGYDIVYTPFAELYHLESVSRGENLTPEQIDRDARERAAMRARWGERIDRDPFYSPNLTLMSEDYSLAFPPRAERPWKSTRS